LLYYTQQDAKPENKLTVSSYMFDFDFEERNDGSLREEEGASGLE
jgi:hypothetical protein